MKAMVLEKTAPVDTNPLALKELPDPEPGPGEVRISIHACGICHTDLHIIEAEIPAHKLPLVIGHQIVGEVDRLGQGVKSWKPGDRVGVPWLNRTDQDCVYCSRGMENLCENGLFTGYDVDGGLAEYTVQDADWVYPIPGDYPDLMAAPLLCAGIIGFRALRLSEIRGGQRLGLFGFGASAHIAIQVARFWGCEVFVFTRSKRHRDLAKKLGAAWTGGVEDQAPGPLDSAVIFAPAGPIVPEALRFTRKGGTVACAGIYMTPIPELDYNTLLYHERTLRSVANSTRQDCMDMLEIAPRVPVQTEVQVFSLEEANKALNKLKNSRINGAGVIKIS